ncbi:hypothetical protein OAL57_01530 [bacterium]|nr:hypothetical protein [bacterium]
MKPGHLGDIESVFFGKPGNKINWDWDLELLKFTQDSFKGW